MKSFKIFLTTLNRRAIVYYLRNQVYRVEDEAGYLHHLEDLSLVDKDSVEKALLLELLADAEEAHALEQ